MTPWPCPASCVTSSTARVQGRHSGGDLLVDWAYLLNALVDAYNQTIGGEGFRKRAEEVAQKLLGSFADARTGALRRGGISRSGGLPPSAEKPLPENIAAVTGLMKLDQATFPRGIPGGGQGCPERICRCHRVYGEFAASYGMLLDQYLHEPLEITVEGNFGEASARELLGAAAQVSCPHLVIKAVPLEEAGSMAQAHVCLNTVCLPPVETPEALLATVAGATSGEDDPFPSIFQIFQGLSLSTRQILTSGQCAKCCPACD